MLLLRTNETHGGSSPLPNTSNPEMMIPSPVSFIVLDQYLEDVTEMTDPL